MSYLDEVYDIARITIENEPDEERWEGLYLDTILISPYIVYPSCHDIVLKESPSIEEAWEIVKGEFGERLTEMDATEWKYWIAFKCMELDIEQALQELSHEHA